MRKPSNDLNHIKNRILALVYIFRSLPSYYFEEFVITYEDKNKIRFVINNLIQDGVLKKKPSLRKKIQYILLTKKGHDFVTKDIFKNSQMNKPFYVYRTDRLVRFTDSDHRFMNFVYIWDWIKSNTKYLDKGVQIFEDSNRNYCKLKFSYIREDIYLYPDILIFIPDKSRGSEFKKAVIIENDTGTETSRALFRKLVDYAGFAEKGLKQGFITQAELIFVLHSYKRWQRLLPKIPNHARNYNSTLKLKDFKAVSLLQAYSGEGMKLTFQALDAGDKEKIFIDVPSDLRKELLKQNPSW